MTEEQIQEIVERTVYETLVSLRLKASPRTSGRIYRGEMIEILGSERQFNNAVRGGWLKVSKGPHQQSRVWASMEDWTRFLKQYVNNEI